MVTIDPGEFSHLVDVYTCVSNRTGKGDSELSFTPADPPDEYVSIEPVAGRELIAARQVRADISHKICMACRPDVTHRTKLVWNDGVRERSFWIGPEVDSLLMGVKCQYYAIEIR